MMKTRTGRVLLLLIVFSPDLRPSDFRAESLKGLENVFVKVSVTAKGKAFISSSTIQTQVELKLRLAGIRISPAPNADPRVGYLTIEVTAFGTDNEAMHVIELRLFQQAYLQRSPATSMYLSTWDFFWFGSTGRTGSRPFSDQVKADISDAMDEFLNAYLSVNPSAAK